jgi:hypothetical protein
MISLRDRLRHGDRRCWSAGPVYSSKQPFDLPSCSIATTWVRIEALRDGVHPEIFEITVGCARTWGHRGDHGNDQHRWSRR